MIVPQASYDAASGKFSDDAFGAVIARVRADGHAGDMNDKQLKAVCMPFAKFKMEEAAGAGPAALDVRLPFDEQRMLADNTDYLLRSLKIDSISVHAVTDDAAVASAPGKVDVAAAYPGSPVVVFRTEVVTPAQ